MLYAQGQDRDNTLVQQAYLAGRKRISRAQGVDSGIIQRLVCVDIPQTRDDLLVQQRLLNRAFAHRETPCQSLHRKLVTQRFRSQSLQCFSFKLTRPQFDTPKFAWIGIQQTPPISQVERGATIFVGAQFIAPFGVGGRNELRPYTMYCRASSIPGYSIDFPQAGIDLPSRREQQQIARHTAVNSQDQIATQIQYKKFPPSSDRQDIPSGNFS